MRGTFNSAVLLCEQVRLVLPECMRNCFDAMRSRAACKPASGAEGRVELPAQGPRSLADGVTQVVGACVAMGGPAGLV